jgi:type I restriction enzyme, S subunit
LQTLSISIPKKLEQQKIASCLSSLDELISAHSQKLDLLKDHKKGLMRNLFPKEGEKVPKYRFKEFEKDGVWVERKLGQIGEPLMCKRIFKEQTTTNSNKGIPFYKIGTFGRQADAFISIELYEEFKRKYSFPNVGDILISASGTIGRLVVYDGLPAYFQDSNIVWLGNDEKLVINDFLYHCYSILKWQTSDGGVISRLYNSDLKNIGIKFPKGKIEQQKIAACLSSLDSLITAQSEKIEQLKMHKKGLMQGLFPKIAD